jgi:phosphomannomutase
MENLEAQDWREAARRWIENDPDPATHAELSDLLRTGDQSDVADHMAGDLSFGTAGLRGLLGAGPMRMNRAVVIRASHAIAQYLVSGQATGPVVVGFDARHASRDFAEDCAGVLAAHGLSVRFYPDPTPTPLVVYAAQSLGACAAIVVTASHNPVGYSGLKLYGADAVQILPPADDQIAALIRSAPPARQVPRVEQAFAGGHAQVAAIDQGVFVNYLRDLERWRPSVTADRNLRIVYTPLHGVGWWFAQKALFQAGYRDLYVVPEQSEPNPAFPTTPRPNPEEPGALDRVKELGQRVGADLALINDPDADRLCVCVPDQAGQFHALDGNQIGVLLADFLLAHAALPVQVVSTVVSSPMLDAVARRYGAHMERTLTGFKWICSAGLELERRRAAGFLFGYEEAYGYAIPLVHDKDGISAAVLFADLAAWCRAQGLTIRQQLERLYQRHGLWVSHQRCVSLQTSDVRRIERAMRLLTDGAPQKLAGRPLANRVDYRVGGNLRPRWLPASDLVELRLADGSRVRIRPSGTEPKLKIYVDLFVATKANEELGTQEARAMIQAQQTAEDLVTWLGLG